MRQTWGLPVECPPYVTAEVPREELDPQRHRAQDAERRFLRARQRAEEQRETKARGYRLVEVRGQELDSQARRERDAEARFLRAGQRGEEQREATARRHSSGPDETAGGAPTPFERTFRIG